MVDRRHAVEFLSRLPQDDSFRMLEEITFWLKALRDAYGLVPKRTLEVIDLFDVTAYPHQRKLADYFVMLGARYQNYQAQRAWNTSFQYCHELGSAYRFLIEQYRERITGHEQLRPMLPLILARAMRALKNEIKWTLLRRGALDPSVWEAAGELYTYAEENRLLTEDVTLYPAEQTTSNIRREYLQALMLSISSIDSLSQDKLHLGESFIRHYADLFALERTPRRGCHYFVDLKSDRPPARLLQRVQPGPSIRYFGPDRAAESVDSLIERVTQRNTAPNELELGGNYSAEAVLEVLEHLARYWNLTPPTRASERKRAIMRINVVHDFGSIMSMVSGESQELDFSSSMETWTLQNESKGGFGAVVTEGSGDWLEVGSLLGIRLEEGASWGIGVVRRLLRPNSGAVYVGIESLARGAVRVDVEGASKEARNDALLLLSDSEGSAQKPELSLMLPSGTFGANKNLTVHTFGRSYPLSPERLIERGEGYERAHFKVLQGAQAS